MKRKRSQALELRTWVLERRQGCLELKSPRFSGLPLPVTDIPFLARSPRHQKPAPYHLLLGELHHHLVCQLLLSQQLCFLFLALVIYALNLSLYLQFLLVPLFHVLPAKGREPQSRREKDQKILAYYNRETQIDAGRQMLPLLSFVKEVVNDLFQQNGLCSLHPTSWKPDTVDLYILSGSRGS